MAKTKNEVRIYMKHRVTHNQEISAAKAGMTAKTGRKYEKNKDLINEKKQARDYKTRPDPFAEHDEYIKQLFIKSPELHSKTILDHLRATFPHVNYDMSQLRTLSRRIKPLRLIYGKAKEVFFPQEILPGIESQSDWTHMDELNINIAGQHLKHYLFHFMLPYSCWESVRLCYSESFDSLAQGYNKAATELGGVTPYHKTDNSSTATKKATSGRNYTDRYTELLEHYQVSARRNNPGKGNENGSVEKSHDLFKTAVNQALLIRGSREFANLEDYQIFLEVLVTKRNLERGSKLAEEYKLLNPLPSKPYIYTELKEVSVNKFSLIRINNCNYSVPSKYIGNKLDAVIGCDEISLYYQDQLMLSMPKIVAGNQINYIHLIDNLIRKPGAFKNYKYRDSLYPNPVYKQTYELLEQDSTSHVKDYLNVLYLAKYYGQQAVTTLLQDRLNIGDLVKFITSGEFEKQIKVVPAAQPQVVEGSVLKQPSLAAFDKLLSNRSTLCD